MAAPTSAPTIEILTSQDQIAILNARIEKLEAIIELYIAPMPELFSDDDGERFNAVAFVSKRRDLNKDRLNEIPDMQGDIQELNHKFDALIRKQKPGEITEKRLKKTNESLIARNNMPISFSEMRRLQEFKQRQDMTKLGHLYQQYPDRYEVRDSSLGGKTVKLNSVYFKHLLKERV